MTRDNSDRPRHRTRDSDDPEDRQEVRPATLDSGTFTSLILKFSGDVVLRGDAGGSYGEAVSGSALTLLRVESGGFDGFILEDIGATHATIALVVEANP